MIVEARRDIPWTKPDDIAYDAGAARAETQRRQSRLLPRNVRRQEPSERLSENIDEKTLGALITRNGVNRSRNKHRAGGN